MATLRLEFRSLASERAGWTRRRWDRRESTTREEQIRPWPRWTQTPDLLRAESGIYVIRSKDSGRILYVGMAGGFGQRRRPGGLLQTIRRHFQQWHSDRCPVGRRRGACPGWRFARAAVEIAIVPTPPRKTLKLEKALIERLDPVYNRQGKARTGRRGNRPIDLATPARPRTTPRRTWRGRAAARAQETPF